jgi:hypothetical protein
MTKSAKRTGRAAKKKVASRERISLGLKVTEETKQLIDKMARDSQRTQSQQCEYMIERCLQYDRMMEAMRTTMEMMKTRSVDAALTDLGFTPVREMLDGKVWRAWLEPGHPAAPQRSGFVS